MNNAAKDDSFEKTISRIQKILNDNHIEVDIQLLEGYKGVYSTLLTVAGTNMHTNGKGFSPEQATVGALAELMERLQNMGHYKFRSYFEFKDLYGFTYDPYETYCELKDLYYVKKYLGATVEALEDVEFMRLFQKSMPLHSKLETEKVLTVPYWSAAESRYINIPAVWVEIIYATNGMVAGNTKEEGLVQGISEIFERFSNKMCLSSGVTPPDIPNKIIDSMTRIKEFKDLITKNKNVQVYFKDCSLGIGLPVVCIILFDRRIGKYYVKFGAHPKLDVALERTITELFQGRKYENIIFWSRNPKLFDEDFQIENNFLKIFRDGSGDYPLAFFEDKPSYEFSNIWFEGHASSNKVLLRYLENIINRNHYDLLYRDVSFMGFPSYHIIIPQISEIVTMGDSIIEDITESKKINTYMRHICDLNPVELKEISSYTIRRKISPLKDLSALLEMPFGDKDIFSNTKIAYFLFHIQAFCKEYDQSLSQLQNLTDAPQLKNSREGSFYRCLEQAFKGIFIQQRDHISVMKILGKFYTEEIINLVNNVIDEIYNKSYFKHFPILNCYDCNACLSRMDCKYRAQYSIYNKLMKLWSEANVSDSKSYSNAR